MPDHPTDTTSASSEQYPMRIRVRPKLRRVVIEEELDHPHRQRRLREADQKRLLDWARQAGGYDGETDPHAHSSATFRMINERKMLDEIEEAETVVPLLDNWNYWTKVNDWPSRNRVLEELTTKARKRTASRGEILFLLVICKPMILKVAHSFRAARGHVDAPTSAANRPEARLIERIANDEFEALARAVLLDAFYVCPQPFPGRFFCWLENYLAHRALDQVRTEFAERDDAVEIGDLDRVLREAVSSAPRIAATNYRLWIQTYDIQKLFELADDFAGYRKVRSACQAAVGKLPRRQREVIEQRYYEDLTQKAIAARRGVAESTVRSTHSAALGNLRKDENLLALLEAVGRVRRDRQPAAYEAA